MINWIEATEENFNKYLCENKGIVFLTKNKSILVAKEINRDRFFYLDIDIVILGCKADDIGSPVCRLRVPYQSITHFALLSEYEAILSKQGA